MKMEINELKTVSNTISESKGFWKDYDLMIEKMEKGGFSENEINVFKTSFINQKILLSISELTESMESLRKDQHNRCDDSLMNELLEQSVNEPKIFYMRFIHHLKDTFEDELADTFIRLGDLCGKLNIDIDKHIQMKMTFNSMREEMHGNKKF